MPSLPDHLYNKKILEEIRGLIRRVAKLDFNIDNRLRGQLARMEIFVNLDKPLVSQILVNKKLHRIEYESLPSICFSCGQDSLIKKICSFSIGDKDLTGVKEGSKVVNSTTKVLVEESTKVSPWMVVERHYHRYPKKSRKLAAKIPISDGEGFRFKALFFCINEKWEKEDTRVGFSRIYFKKGDFFKKLECEVVNKGKDGIDELKKVKVGCRQIVSWK